METTNASETVPSLSSHVVEPIAEGQRQESDDQIGSFVENKNGLNFLHLNIHHIYPKLDEIKLLLSSHINIDVMAFCETFLNETFTNSELDLPNFNLYRKDRNGNGGVLAVYVCE